LETTRTYWLWQYQQAGGNVAEGGLERSGKTLGQIFELKANVRVDQLLGRQFRLVPIHQDRHDGLRNEGKGEEENAGDEEDTGATL